MPQLCFKAPNIYIYRINVCSSADFAGDEQQHVNFEFMHLNNQVPLVLLTKMQNFFLLKSDQLIDDSAEQAGE